MAITEERASRVEEAQRRIDALVERIQAALPETDFALRPGVTDADLDDAEHRIGFEFPDDLRALYRVCDGQGYPSTPLLPWPMRPLAEAIRNWELSAESVEGLEPQTSFHPGVVLERFASPGWLPIADYRGGNHLAVDLTPGPRGSYGQIIGVGNDMALKVDWAPSLTVFMERLVGLLEIGRWEPDPDVEDDDPMWWSFTDVDFHTDNPGTESSCRAFRESNILEEPVPAWVSSLGPTWRRQLSTPARVLDFLDGPAFTVRGGHTVVDLAPLRHCRSLRDLTVTNTVLDSLEEIPAALDLSRLTVCTRSLRGLDRFPLLQFARIDLVHDQRVDPMIEDGLATLRSMTGLQALDLWGFPTDCGPELRRIRSLVSVSADEEILDAFEDTHPEWEIDRGLGFDRRGRPCERTTIHAPSIPAVVGTVPGAFVRRPD